MFLANEISYSYINTKPSKGPLIWQSNEVSTPIWTKVMGSRYVGGPDPKILKWSQRNEIGAKWKVFEHLFQCTLFWLKIEIWRDLKIKNRNGKFSRKILFMNATKKNCEKILKIEGDVFWVTSIWKIFEQRYLQNTFFMTFLFIMTIIYYRNCIFLVNIITLLQQKNKV